MPKVQTVLFDMDGVLVDFAGGAANAHFRSIDRAKAPWNFHLDWGMTDYQFWDLLRTELFWSHLEPLADGMDLFNRVVADLGHDRVSILTSSLCPGSSEGKRAWLQEYLPDFADDVFFGYAKWKIASPRLLLVDDSDSQITKWCRDREGHGILVPRSWNSACGRIDAAGNFNVDELYDEIMTIAT